MVEKAVKRIDGVSLCSTFLGGGEVVIGGSGDCSIDGEDAVRQHWNDNAAVAIVVA